MSAGGDLRALTGFLDRLRLLLWTAGALAALLRGAAVAAVAAVLNTLVAERSGAGPWAVFALALCGNAAVLVAAVLLARALPPPSRAAAARRVQAVEPGMRTDVESSLALGARAPGAAEPAFSGELVGALVGSTAERLSGLPASRFVPWRGVRAGALLLAAALLPLGALALTGGVPGAALRALVDPRAYWPLGRLSFTVEPGDVRIARGSDLVVRVRTGGARPGAVLVGYEGATGEGAAAMERGPDGVWSWRFVAVTGDFRYRALARGAASGWHQVRAADAPAAGNFEVTYTYPAYSGLGTRRVAGSGELEALRGTTAEIAFASTVELAKAVLVAGTNRVAVQPAGGLRYRVALYLGGEDSYRLELEDAQGLGNGGGPAYAIRLLPDAAPTVEVSEPAGEVESDPRATVLVRYRAADDFGLSRLALVARSAAGERRQPLALTAGSRSAGGEHEWDLGPLAASPGEVVSAFVEAADNDTISGPKTAASAPIVVRIADPRVKREQVRESMDKLGEDLLQLLADELDLQERYEELSAKTEPWEKFPWEQAEEAAARQRAARETAARAEERADRIAEALERDPAAEEESAFQAELIREGLAALRERQQAPMADMAASMRPGDATQEEARQKTAFLAESAAKAARAAEQLALMADAMQRERRMADIFRGGQEMAEAEDRLLAGLEKLSPGDRKAAEEVLKQLAEIERELRDLAEALEKESEELPEEFLNSEAIESLDVKDVLDAVEQVRELVRRGDIAGARKAARDLAAKLADLRNRLRQGREEVDERSRQALERLGQKTVPQLQDLAERQRQLLERTEALERQAGPRYEQRLREMALARDPSPAPAEADLLTPEERGRTGALAREQEGLREQVGSLAAEVDALRGALPFLPAEIGEDLREAGGHMAGAGGLLAGHEPGRAVPPERLALAALQRARDQAAQALDDLSQMQQMRQGSTGRPMAMGSGSPSPGAGRDTPRGRRSGGRRGLDVRNFVIPGRQDHQVPKVFREELMKSLRDGYPPQYEERIRDYYQRIAE